MPARVQENQQKHGPTKLSSLADKAFRDVPENYVRSQTITKFLQALTDKAAGKAASMLKPRSLAAVVDSAVEVTILSDKYNKL